MTPVQAAARRPWSSTERARRRVLGEPRRDDDELLGRFHAVGAWVTCEETINGPDVFDDFTRGSLPPTTYIKNAQLTRPHGYVFEVPVEARRARSPCARPGVLPTRRSPSTPPRARPT